jgi:hypothetical protein
MAYDYELPPVDYAPTPVDHAPSPVRPPPDLPPDHYPENPDFDLPPPPPPDSNNYDYGGYGDDYGGYDDEYSDDLPNSNNAEEGTYIKVETRVL